MELGTLGPQGVTDEDINYRGGRFSEVRDAIFANPYQRVWGSQGEPPLPVYKVTLSGVLAGLLPFGKSYQFLDAAKRTVDSRADLRRGPDGKGYRRLLHSNGVCLAGQWEITEESPYSGYFKRGSKGLVIGRCSTCCTETRRGHNRSLSLVGKIYPLTTGAVFLRADTEPSIRQLYEITELEKSEREPTICPECMRLLVAPEQPRIAGEALDFRDEVMAQIYER